MTPTQVKALRRRLGLTQSRFADLVGVHVVTVKKWETGAQGMRATADRLIRLLLAQKAPERRRTRRRGGREQ